MTEQALIYIFAVPGILALYGAAVWLGGWRRTKSLDAEIAVYRAERAAVASANGRSAEPFRVAMLDPVDALMLARAPASRARSRRARAESMRMSPLRPRHFPPSLTPGEQDS